ncbi:MAG TPA: S41 family peptidase [Bryobacteraceae bacterium]|jgi:carboxyl-terminal processing protease|nr:S41 family peptidase [Bryobacteraceae bacterium]
MSSQRRYFVFVPVFLVSCALIGGAFGPGARAADQKSNTPSDEDLKASMEAFTKIYDVVDENLADKLSADKGIYKGAIPGMLRTLDPHSNFFDPKEFAAMREDQQGKYYGVGMQIGPQPRTGKTMVIHPFGGSPAYKAGLRPGDLLMEVNDKRVDNLNTSQVADLLRGPKGTAVQIVVRREGTDEPITFNVIRGEIPRDSVERAFWVKPGIAYMKIEQFSAESTFKEVEDNLNRLGEQNIKGLVLDLRDNPGGLLTEGVAVAGRWLDRGQVVVSHKGRAYSEKPYLARGSQYGESYSMVVLVDRMSASAAEIVAGALQDHDRAWILGETTFGKGLVQTVYPLSDNTGLALTTQHYYTPSGRLIQRDYSNISFLDYYYGKRAEQKDPLDVKQTDIGRVVYGGGGITPDEKYEAPKPDRFEMDILRKNGLFNFTAQYFGTHSTKLPKNWVPTEAVLEQFHDYMMKQGVDFTEADWTRDHSWVRDQLRTEMYVTAFSYEDSEMVAEEQDPEVAAAVAAMPKAADLLARSKERNEKQRASLR